LTQDYVNAVHMDVPGDVDRLRAVLELAAERQLDLARVRVGSVEIQLAPRSTPPAGAEPVGRPPTREELERRAREEFVATMYAASEGPDFD